MVEVTTSPTSSASDGHSCDDVRVEGALQQREGFYEQWMESNPGRALSFQYQIVSYFLRRRASAPQDFLAALHPAVAGTDEIETSPMSRRSRREPKVPGKLLPLLECLGAITSHKFGSLFKHKLESQGLVENNVSVEGASYGNRTPDLSRAENNGGFNGDMRELVDLLSKLNPLAEEFIPQPHRSPSFIFNGNGSFANNGRRKKNSFNQGKRRLNGRNIRAQQEDSVRRTVYVSDIDQQVTEEQLAALFINCGQWLLTGFDFGFGFSYQILYQWQCLSACDCCTSIRT